MAYEELQLGIPGAPACPNQYDEESTLYCPGSNRLLIQVANQAITIELGICPQGKGSGLGSVVWQPAKTLLPVIASLGRAFDAVRVKNRVAGLEAQVLLSVDTA
jgi:hypothetical protein